MSNDFAITVKRKMLFAIINLFNSFVVIEIKLRFYN